MECGRRRARPTKRPRCAWRLRGGGISSSSSAPRVRSSPRPGSRSAPACRPRIVELPFKEGDHVAKGNPTAKPPVPASVLVQLDSKDLEAQLKSVEARHAAEEASLEVSRTHVVAQQARIDSLKVMLTDARRELDRQNLSWRPRTSANRLDTLQTKVDQQEADLDAAVASKKGEEEGLVVLQHNIEAAAGRDRQGT